MIQSVRQPRALIVSRWRGYSVVLDVKACCVALGLLTCLIMLVVFATSVGRLPIGLPEVMAIIGGEVSGFKAHVLIDIRIPRILTAVFAGAALGASGAIFQSISRNPLGSPDIIGFTSGSATGALIQIILFEGSAAQVAIAAILGGLVTALLVFVLSLRHGSVGRQRLVLTGIGVGAVLMALNGLLLVKGQLDQAISANLWLAGSLHARTWQHVWPLMTGVVVIMPLLVALSRPLLLLEMGESRSATLGVHVTRVRGFGILGAVMLAALATGAAGPIGFIALAAPQLTKRLITGHSLPTFSAALMGAVLLLSADLITQLLPLAWTMPIGRVTSIVGGVYLLWLLTRLNRDQGTG